MILFDRSVALEFGQPGSPDGRRMDGVRINFEVVQSKASEPNSMVVEVYNPNPKSIGLAQQEGTIFRLLAGYKGYPAATGRVERQLFQGDATKFGVTMRKRGSDRVLRIEAKDGGRTYRLAMLDISWSTEATVNQVLDEALGALGLPRGVVQTPNDVRWPQGLTFQGRARDLLARIAATQSADWFIRDGAFYMVQKGSSTPETAPVYSVANKNLIGSPTPKDKGAIEVTVLLDAGMRPGRQFVVESDAYSGTYIAGDVRHHGDSGWENPFYTKIHGAPPAPPPKPPTELPVVVIGPVGEYFEGASNDPN